MMKKSNTALKHYGVLGQKWGVRRSGKSKSTRPPASKLTDKQLKASISRMRLEREYKSLSMTDSEKRRKAMIDNFTSNTVSRIGNAVVGAAIDSTAKRLVKGING